MNNIERERVHGRIITSFYMNRGNLEKVEQETGYDFALVKKVTDKLRKRIKYDISYHLANMMYDSIRIGSQQRTYVFTECLNQLRGATQVEVSACCGRAMVTMDVETETGSEPVILCSKCQKPVIGTKIVQQAEIYRLIKEYTDELRAEENHLLAFAKGMGITADDTPKAPIIQQNFVTMPSPIPYNQNKPASKGQDVTDPTQNLIAKEIEELTPRERRRLCISLEKKIVEEEVIEAKEQEENEISE